MSDTIATLTGRVAAIRDAAAEALVERGWTRGTYELELPASVEGAHDSPDNGYTNGICASAAFQLAVGLSAQPAGHDEAVAAVGWDNVFLMHVVKRAFVLHLAQTYSSVYVSVEATPPVALAPWRHTVEKWTSYGVIAPVGSSYLDRGIVDFNDNPYRTAYDVLDAIMGISDETIAQAVKFEAPSGCIPPGPITDPATRPVKQVIETPFTPVWWDGTPTKHVQSTVLTFDEPAQAKWSAVDGPDSTIDWSKFDEWRVSSELVFA